MVIAQSILIDKWDLFNLLNEEILQELFADIINDYIFFIDVRYSEFWELHFEKILNILEEFFLCEKLFNLPFKSSIFYNNSKYSFYKLVSNRIKSYFNNYFSISSNFMNLLKYNDIFYEYFEVFKKFVLFFLNKQGINKFYGECLYEPDIEDPETKLIKIKIYLPYDDFNKIIDIWEKFQLDEQKYLNYLFFNHPYKKDILQIYKKKYLIFRQIEWVKKIKSY